MSISRGRLIYNLSFILITFILGIIYYGNTIASIFFLICFIGVFMTLDRVVERSRKNDMRIGLPIAFIFFVIVMVSVLLTQ